jgi:hypothetical protein
VAQCDVIEVSNYVSAVYEINSTFYTVTDINESKLRLGCRKRDILSVFAHLVISLAHFHPGLDLNNGR